MHEQLSITQFLQDRDFLGRQGMFPRILEQPEWEFTDQKYGKLGYRFGRLDYKNNPRIWTIFSIPQQESAELNGPLQCEYQLKKIKWLSITATERAPTPLDERVFSLTILTTDDQGELYDLFGHGDIRFELDYFQTAKALRLVLPLNIMTASYDFIYENEWKLAKDNKFPNSFSYISGISKVEELSRRLFQSAWEKQPYLLPTGFSHS